MLLTALQLQGTGLRVQREAAEIHVTGGCHCHSVQTQKHTLLLLHSQIHVWGKENGKCSGDVLKTKIKFGALSHLTSLPEVRAVMERLGLQCSVGFRLRRINQDYQLIIRERAM